MTNEQAQPETLDGTPLVGRDIEALTALAVRLRRDILEATYRAGSGHPGGSFSELEVLLALYHGGVMRFSPSNPHHPERDTFILSKGHACPGLYAVLGDLGFFPREELWRMRRFGALLQGHVDRKVPGIEMSAGSLGMGLGYANGIALAHRLDDKPNHVYVMLGDGECQEGNIWESAMTSAHRHMDGVTAIIDANRIQIDGFVDDVKRLEPIGEKFRAFGWRVLEVDGHDLEQLFAAFDTARATKGTPTMIVAHTTKGKGVSFMEDKAEFHGRALNEEEMRRAMAELGADWNPVSGWTEVGA